LPRALRGSGISLRASIKLLIHQSWSRLNSVYLFSQDFETALGFIPVGGHDMKKISYSKDVDALLVELSDKAIAYAEDEGQVILHYSPDNKVVLVEILDFRRFMSDETITTLLAS
jgi:hypothetical protein